MDLYYATALSALFFKFYWWLYTDIAKTNIERNLLIKKKFQFEARGRWVSNTHVKICLFLVACNYLMETGISIIVANSVGFWLVDIIFHYLEGKTLDLCMNLHHIVSIFLTAYTGYYRPIVTMKGLISEISTVNLNNCWIMIKEDRENSEDFRRQGAWLFINFLVFRVVNFSLLIWQYSDNKPLEWWIFIIIWILNLYWFGKLASKVSFKNEFQKKQKK